MVLQLLNFKNKMAEIVVQCGTETVAFLFWNHKTTSLMKVKEQYFVWFNCWAERNYWNSVFTSKLIRWHLKLLTLKMFWEFQITSSGTIQNHVIRDKANFENVLFPLENVLIDLIFYCLKHKKNSVLLDK